MRSLKLISSSALMVALCTLLACGGQPETDGEPTPNDPQSGGLEDAPSDAPAGQDENPGNPLGIGKITICHIPPGNPANAHTITVGLPALKAHTKHGDTLGACGTSGEVDAGTGGGDAGTDGGDAGADGGDAGTDGGNVDAGPAPDAGTGGGDVDAGAPECAPVGATCGSGVACCDGLTCGPEGYCEPIIG